VEKKLTKYAYQSTTVFISYFKKMKGTMRQRGKVDYIDSTISAAGALIAMLVVSFIVLHLGHPIAIAPLGASCILVFGAHKGLLSQPRHVIGGHLLSTTCAIIILDLLGKSVFSLVFVLAFVLFLMALTETMHPPAAASALVAINNEVTWEFLLPIVFGALVIVFISTIYNNAFRARQYPTHWF